MSWAPIRNGPRNGSAIRSRSMVSGSNAQFAKFVDATGYKTLAERGVDPKTHPGMEQQSVPGSVVFIKPTEITRGGDLTQWWQYVKGANWREPEGPGSSIKGKENYPVGDVSYEDALADAHWLGRELPTEAQWEYAARGGHNEGEDWSQAFDKDGKPIANPVARAFAAQQPHLLIGL